MSSGLELKSAAVPPSLEGFDFDERVEAMVEWFNDNFEDPAQHTPHDSGEGGYQYIWGGPYDALDEIGSAFPDATDEEIQAAAEEVQSDGIYDWAPADGRIQPDDYADDVAPEPPLQDRIGALRGQLDELEDALRNLREVAPMMGHNHPPEEMRIGLDQRDLDEAQASIDEIRVELTKADPLEEADPVPLDRAESRFRALAAKIKGWAVMAGKWIGAGIGGAIGKELWEDPVELHHKIDTVASTLGSWVQHLQLPF